MENWEKIMHTEQSARAEIARGLLEQHGINAVIVNKKDSNYTVFGYFEVFVPIQDVEAAKRYLADEVSPE
jgi:hypothetical protein